MEDEETETVETEEHTTEHEPVTHHENVMPLIDELKNRIDELSETVAQIVTTGGDRDSQPVKRPWTHWGGNH